MKNLYLLVGVLLVIIIGLVAANAFLGQEKTSQETAQTEASPTSNLNPADSQPDQNTQSGGYVTYSPEALASAASDRRVLFFYANWCPTCQPADESFSTNQSQLPTDVTVLRVNYNDTQTDQAEKDLAKKYGVTYQHTFVQIDAAGNEVAKWNGGKIDELLSNIK